MADDAKLLEIIAATYEGILATVKPSAHPQLTNVYYRWDPEERTARISTTADRLKARNLRRHPQAALHVSGAHFYSWAVAEGEAELSPITESPGDETGRELLPVYETFSDPVAEAGSEEAFFERLVAERRLVIRLRVSRLYGVAVARPPR
jgi:PPOX class probable F420-dependent enzyme